MHALRQGVAVLVSDVVMIQNERVKVRFCDVQMGHTRRSLVDEECEMRALRSCRGCSLGPRVFRR